MGLPRTYMVCLLIVKTLTGIRRDRSGGALRSLLATGKYSAPARSQLPTASGAPQDLPPSCPPSQAALRQWSLISSLRTSGCSGTHDSEAQQQPAYGPCTRQ